MLSKEIPSGMTPPACASRTSRGMSMPYDAQRVSAMLSQLTLEEKISLLSGHGFATTAAVPRLGIPSMKLVEGINGVKDAMQIDGGDEALTDVLSANGPSTVCFPSTSCLGATWNVDLMAKMGTSLASQARKKDIQVVLGPALNIHRDPRGGRNFEYFSEDPFLSGHLSAYIVNGIQQEGVGACPKQVVANDAENYRRHYNVVDSVDSRAICEISMAAFQELLRMSNPVALMTSYNKLDGKYCSESPIMEDIIRKEWGYDGVIISDWFGTTSTVPAVVAGLDLEMPGPPIFRGTRLLEAIKAGDVSESQIDQRSKKMLEWIEKTSQPSSKSILGEAETISLARQIASEGIILLKNEQNILPLDPMKPVKITVVGFHAIDPPMGGGGSSLAPPQYRQLPLESIRASSSYPEFISFGGGVRCNKTVPLAPTHKMFAQDGSNGMDVVYRNNDSPEPMLREVQGGAQVLMLGHLKPGLNKSDFTYEMSTILRPDTDGCHTIAVQSTGGFQLFIDDIEVITSSPPVCTAEDYLFDPIVLEKSYMHEMKAGQMCTVKIIAQSWKSAVESGGPMDVGDFIDDVDVLIHAHYLGQEGGSALADIISGKVNPSGKLAVTWPKCIEDVATFNYFPASKKYDLQMSLVEGIEVGYRRNWPSPPRFPFGFGLSYTSFAYSDLTVERNVTNEDSDLIVHVKVTNTGVLAGHEVVQVYVSDVESSVWRPHKELKGFKKVWLEPKSPLTVQVPLDTKSALSFWDEKSLSWRAEQGTFRIMVGELSSSFELGKSFTWNGL